MEQRKTVLCFMYLAILLPQTVFGSLTQGHVHKNTGNGKHRVQKRFAVVPAIYWGAAVAPEVYAGLVVLFGAAAVAAHRVFKDYSKSDTETDNNCSAYSRRWGRRVNGWCWTSCPTGTEVVRPGGNYGCSSNWYDCCLPWR